MPKMKTHKGAQKRFKKTSSGKIRRRRANKKHILEKKSPKRKRQARRPAVIADGDEARVRRMLGI